MMGKFQRTLFLLVMAGITSLMAGCGGEDAFTTTAGGTDTPTGVAQVASVILLASTPTLGSSNASEVQLTAQVKDSNNALMSGQSVIFTASSGGLLVDSPSTNEAGLATATLSTAGDQSNRTITVTATAGGVSDSLDVTVTGTTISVSGESSVVFGKTIDLTIFLKDSDGNGVSGQAVTVSSAKNNTLSAASLTTGASGGAQVTLTGDVAGTDTITASALGETA